MFPLRPLWRDCRVVCEYRLDANTIDSSKAWHKLTKLRMVLQRESRNRYLWARLGHGREKGDPIVGVTNTAPVNTSFLLRKTFFVFQTCQPFNKTWQDSATKLSPLSFVSLLVKHMHETLYLVYRFTWVFYRLHGHGLLVIPESLKMDESIGPVALHRN